MSSIRRGVLLTQLQKRNVEILFLRTILYYFQLIVMMIQWTKQKWFHSSTQTNLLLLVGDVARFVEPGKPNNFMTIICVGAWKENYNLQLNWSEFYFFWFDDNDIRDCRINVISNAIIKDEQIVFDKKLHIFDICQFRSHRRQW